MTQRINFDALTNLGSVADPINASDAATKIYVDSRVGTGVQRVGLTTTGVVLSVATTIGNTSFTVSGNQTALFSAGLRIQIGIGSSNQVLTVASATAGVTTTTVNVTPAIAVASAIGTIIYSVSLTAISQLEAGNNITLNSVGTTTTINATAGAIHLYDLQDTYLPQEYQGTYTQVTTTGINLLAVGSQNLSLQATGAISPATAFVLGQAYSATNGGLAYTVTQVANTSLNFWQVDFSEPITGWPATQSPIVAYQFTPGANIPQGQALTWDTGRSKWTNTYAVNTIAQGTQTKFAPYALIWNNMHPAFGEAPGTGVSNPYEFACGGVNPNTFIFPGDRISIRNADGTTIYWGNGYPVATAKAPQIVSFAPTGTPPYYNFTWTDGGDTAALNALTWPIPAGGAVTVWKESGQKPGATYTGINTETFSQDFTVTQSGANATISLDPSGVGSQPNIYAADKRILLAGANTTISSNDTNSTLTISSIPSAGGLGLKLLVQVDTGTTSTQDAFTIPGLGYLSITGQFNTFTLSIPRPSSPWSPESISQAIADGYKTQVNALADSVDVLSTNIVSFAQFYVVTTAPTGEPTQTDSVIQQLFNKAVVGTTTAFQVEPIINNPSYPYQRPVGLAFATTAWSGNGITGTVEPILVTLSDGMSGAWTDASKTLTLTSPADTLQATINAGNTLTPQSRIVYSSAPTFVAGDSNALITKAYADSVTGNINYDSLTPVPQTYTISTVSSAGATRVFLNAIPTTPLVVGALVGFGSNSNGPYSITATGSSPAYYLDIAPPLLIATAIGDSVYTYSAVRSTFTDLVVGRNLVSTVQNNRLIISATGGGSTTGSRALDFGTITSPAGFNLDLGTFI